MDTMSSSERDATRSSLLRRVKDLSDKPGWSRFYDTYAPLVERFALKSGLNKYETQEVVQNTMIQMAEKLPAFEYDRSKGSFKSWLFTTAKWKITDALRDRKKGANAIDAEPEDPAESTFEKLWDAEWEGHLWRQALEATKLKVSGAHFQIFCLYVIEGLAPEKVANLVGVTVAQVYLTKCRVGRCIKRELAALRKADP
jgi:RNA polymerase sigma factor (sigma-70 family)